MTDQHSVSRRTFLGVGTAGCALASASIAFPHAARAIASPPTQALASHARQLPGDWSGRTVILRGDYSARLARIRSTLATTPPERLRLFLDSADKVLFDIAAQDATPCARALIRRQRAEGAPASKGIAA